MKAKKGMSLLLALVLALSLGVTAFANGDGYNWTPIPTSPEGLTAGEYYIDWTGFCDLLAEGDDQAAPGYYERMAEIYNDGTFYIDYEAHQLTGTTVVPADFSESGEEETIELSLAAGRAYLQYILCEVDAEWLPVAKSTQGLSNGPVPRGGTVRRRRCRCHNAVCLLRQSRKPPYAI